MQDVVAQVGYVKHMCLANVSIQTLHQQELFNLLGLLRSFCDDFFCSHFYVVAGSLIGYAYN